MRYPEWGYWHRHLTPRLLVNLLIGEARRQSKRTCGVGIKLKGSRLVTWTNWPLWGGRLTQSSNPGGNSFHTGLGKDQTWQWIQGEANSLIDPRVRLICLFQWTKKLHGWGPTIKRGRTWFATGQGRAKLGSLHPEERTSLSFSSSSDSESCPIASLLHYLDLHLV